MINTDLLKSKMLLKGDRIFVEDLKNTLDCTRPTASTRLNGTSEWTQSEIIKCAEKYELTPDDIVNIYIKNEA